jgi:hypothetical protein
MAMELPTVQGILKAKNVLSNVVETTPLKLNEHLSEEFGSKIYLKREDLQVVRSYKIRGAYNLMSQLSAAQKKQGRRLFQCRQSCAGICPVLQPAENKRDCLYAGDYTQTKGICGGTLG